jgi:hypothetical protein
MVLTHHTLGSTQSFSQFLIAVSVDTQLEMAVLPSCHLWKCLSQSSKQLVAGLQRPGRYTAKTLQLGSNNSWQLSILVSNRSLVIAPRSPSFLHLHHPLTQHKQHLLARSHHRLFILGSTSADLCSRYTCFESCSRGRHKGGFQG